MNRKRLLAAWAAMCLWLDLAQAQDAPPASPDAEANAQALMDAALRAAETATGAQLGEDLDAWARSVIEAALLNAPAGGDPSSVPAGEHAARVADAVSGEQTNGLPSAGTEVIVFMSLSVPEASWRQWSREAARIGAPMVLRGVKPGGLAETVGEIRRRLGEYGGGDTGPGASPRRQVRRPQVRRPQVCRAQPPCRVQRSIRGCSGCSGSRTCPPWRWSRGACRRARPGAARPIRPRRTTSSPETSAWNRHWRSLRAKAGPGGQREAAPGITEGRGQLNDRTKLLKPGSKRVAAWLAGAVLLGALPHGAAVGQDSDRAAREAAQAVGAAGQAAARAVATDATQPLEVPGFAGTNISQAGLSAGELQSAGRNALADPNDLGGGVGRALTRGDLSGPDVVVSPAEPGIRRAESVQSAPNAPAWEAGGLASGTVSECGRDVDGAQSGGTCGAVTYCVGAGCERVDTPANAGFVDAATAAQPGHGDGRRGVRPREHADLLRRVGDLHDPASWAGRTAAPIQASSSRRGCWAARRTRSNWPKPARRG